MNKQNYKIKKLNNTKEVTIMKNNKFRRSLVAALAALAILIGFISTASIPASAKEYKVYKNDVTVYFFGEQLNEEEFRAFCIETYNCFGTDITIKVLEEATLCPRCKEWIELGGVDYFVDCYFLQKWFKLNGITDGKYKYYYGREWSEPEGWR